MATGTFTFETTAAPVDPTASGSFTFETTPPPVFDTATGTFTFQTVNADTATGTFTFQTTPSAGLFHYVADDLWVEFEAWHYAAANVWKNLDAHTTQPMPVGDLTGWTQIYAEDFDVPFPVGTFTVDSGGNIAPGAQPFARYGSKVKFGLDNIPDNSGAATYYASKTVSTVQNVPNSNGVLDVYFHSELIAGVMKALSAWIRPKLPGDPTYVPVGTKVVTRMRADAAAGYGAAQLLIGQDPWPNNGEQDWPEGPFTQNVGGVYHRANVNQGAQFPVTVTPAASWQDWHVYTIEWTSGHARWYLDSTNVLDTTQEVGANPSKFVIQSGAAVPGVVPNSAVTGHLQIDWIAIYDQP